MGTLTAYAATGDNALGCSNSTWATARAGTGAYADSSSATSHEIGASYYAPTYYVNEYFAEFDTSSIPDGATITGATLALYGKASTGSWTLECGAHDFGASVGTEDWLDGTDLGSVTVLGTRSSSGWTNSGYNDFSDSNGGLATVVSKTGVTRVAVWHERSRTGTAPTNGQYADVWSANEDQSGERRPRLTVTYTEPAARTPIIGGGFL